MYAVVATGGKQYRVEPGTTLLVERLPAEAGATVTFDRVLLVGDGDDVTVGTPLVSGATVSATVLGEERGPKIVIFKFRQKVKYRRRRGHRQQLMRVRIDAINGTGARAEAQKTDKAETAEKPARRAPARSRTKTAEAEAGAADAAAEPKPTRRRTKPAAAEASAEPSTEAAEPAKRTRRASATKRASAPKKAAEEQ